MLINKFFILLLNKCFCFLPPASPLNILEPVDRDSWILSQLVYTVHIL